MNEKNNYYGIIPANVRYDKKLTSNEKLLYSEITSLLRASGKCYASDQYLAGMFDITIRTVQRWLKNLENQNYISREIIYEEGTKQVAKRYITLGGTPKTKMSYPPRQKCHTPHDKNVVGISIRDIEIKELKDSERFDEQFEAFWNLYSYKKNKGQAERAFKSAIKKEGTYEAIMEDLPKRNKSYDWTKENGRYKQYPATYLNNSVWEEAIEGAPKEKKSNKRIPDWSMPNYTKVDQDEISYEEAEALAKQLEEDFKNL